MTNKELQEKLKKYDDDMQVAVYDDTVDKYYTVENIKEKNKGIAGWNFISIEMEEV